jgi:tight adherence protein C
MDQLWDNIGLISSVMFALTLMLLTLALWADDTLEIGGPGSYRKRHAKRSIFIVVFGPLIRSLGAFISLLPLGKGREKLRIRLVQGGSPGGMNPDEFHAARIIGIILAGAAGAFFDNELDMSPVFTGLGLGLGFLYPDIWLKGHVEKRQRRIFRDLPDLLDTLRLAVDAGLDLNSAMKVVVEKGKQGPLLDELEMVEREITLGRTRKEAFKNFADRIAMPEINAFVLALMQADQLGASVGPILKVQAEMARTRRWQLAEALVNKMPMKMLGPLVTFIFPASFIILFTPLIIRWMQSE